MFKLFNEDLDKFLNVTFNDYYSLYINYKKGLYVIGEFKLDQFYCLNRDFLGSEDCFNASEYFEILYEYGYYFYLKMKNIETYFNNMNKNKIVKLKLRRESIDPFLHFMFDEYSKIIKYEEETQCTDNEEMYILASIIKYSFDNIGVIMLCRENGDIMGINNNDRFDTYRFNIFNIGESTDFDIFSKQLLVRLRENEIDIE